MEITAQETKIFDPADGFAPLVGIEEMTDATVVKRGNRWWMYLAGGIHDKPAIQFASASLPEGAPLSASGWKLTVDPKDPTKIAVLAGQTRSRIWDGKGGRHCPSYVKGWDPAKSQLVERIYYAGAAENIWGPYTIGFLEWNGIEWEDQVSPVFVANEDWEHGSVYEPNLIYHDGKWKLWYVAGSNLENYLVHGYAESLDGRSNWNNHKIFFPPEEKVFDFCVRETPRGFEAVFSRVWLEDGPAPKDTGLWWCHAKHPSYDLNDWSKPRQIMTAEDRGWHAGPWKPSWHYGESDPDRMYVFFDGAYSKYVFTQGCLEIVRPE